MEVMSMVKPISRTQGVIAIIALLSIVCFFALLFYMFYRAY